MSALERPVAYTTALTLLRILCQKGYAKPEPDPQGGRAYVYLPAVAANNARRSHVRDLIDRMFNGRPEELVTGLLEDERLSRAQLQQLREQIEKTCASAGDAGGGATIRGYARLCGVTVPSVGGPLGLRVRGGERALGRGEATLDAPTGARRAGGAGAAASADSAGPEHGGEPTAPLGLGQRASAVQRWRRDAQHRLAAFVGRGPAGLPARDDLAPRAHPLAQARPVDARLGARLRDAVCAAPPHHRPDARAHGRARSRSRFGNRNERPPRLREPAGRARVAGTLRTRPCARVDGRHGASQENSHADQCHSEKRRRTSASPLWLTAAAVAGLSLFAPRVFADGAPFQRPLGPHDPMAEHEGEIDECYALAREEDADLVINTRARFEVDPRTFKVISANVPTPASPTFQACVEDKAMTWSFPPPPDMPPPPRELPPDAKAMVAVHIERKP